MLSNITKCCKSNTILTSISGMTLGLISGYVIISGIKIPKAASLVSDKEIEVTKDRVLNKINEVLESFNLPSLKHLSPTIETIIDYGFIVQGYIRLGYYYILPYGFGTLLIGGGIYSLLKYFVSSTNFAGQGNVLRDVRDIIDGSIDEVKRSNMSEDEKFKEIDKMREINKKINDIYSNTVKDDKGDKEDVYEGPGFIPNNKDVEPGILVFRNNNIGIRTRNIEIPEFSGVINRNLDFNRLRMEARNLLINEVRENAIIIEELPEKDKEKIRKRYSKIDRPRVTEALSKYKRILEIILKQTTNRNNISFIQRVINDIDNRGKPNNSQPLEILLKNIDEIIVVVTNNKTAEKENLKKYDENIERNILELNNTSKISLDRLIIYIDSIVNSEISYDILNLFLINIYNRLILRAEALKDRNLIPLIEIIENYDNKEDTFNMDKEDIENIKKILLVIKELYLQYLLIK